MSDFEQAKVKHDRQYGRKVAQARTLRRLSQEDLGDLIGVSRRVIQRLEQGRGCDYFVALQIAAELAGKPVRL